MATSLGKVLPFVRLNTNSSLHGAPTYPLGGVNPPHPMSGPSPPMTLGQGPILGKDYINILNLRDYYKLPYPPVTPLASPPVIGIVSFGGGIYGQPVSSGKYSGFWKCTDVSGANGAPIQILVSPLNGAINAPNADDGGATLENTVDVATVNAFYGMINQGRDAPIYTPPVIILYIAPSDDMEEVYKTFYSVLKNPVVCNGQSYLPSVVCCSWGAPEISWTQKMPFPPSGLQSDVNNDPNPTGIAVMNEINDLFADATRRGINICVASGDIQFPGADKNNDGLINKNDVAAARIMFPASSPYVTCVGGSSVFFPNGPVRNFNNPAEFAWSRAEGGVSSAFPIPDYQSNLPGSALISANAFLASSRVTADLLETALGVADTSVISFTGSVSGTTLTVSAVASGVLAVGMNITGSTVLPSTKITAFSEAVGGVGTYTLNNTHSTPVASTTLTANAWGLTTNASLSAITKDQALVKAQAAFDAANAAYNHARNAGGSDAATLQLQLSRNLANTALTAAEENSTLARAALLDAQDAVVKAVGLETLINEAALAYNVASLSGEVPSDPCSTDPELDQLARDAALLVLNEAVAQGAASVFAPVLVQTLTENVKEAVEDAQKVLEQLVNPYDPFNPVTASTLVPTNLLAIYKTPVGLPYPAQVNLTKLVNITEDLLDEVELVDSSGSAYSPANQSQVASVVGLSSNLVSKVVAQATQAARLAKTVNDDTTVYEDTSSDWNKASKNFQDATAAWNAVFTAVPTRSKDELNSARANLTAAYDALTKESVLLADAGAANLLAANTLKAVTTALLTSVSSSGVGSYAALFTGDSSGLVILAEAANDASGADLSADTVQTDAGNNVIVDLKKLAKVADANAAEAKRSYNDWLSAVAAVPALTSINSATVAEKKNDVVLASEVMRVAAVRLQSSVNAVSVLLNNTRISAAVSAWTNTAAATAVATALTHVNNLVNDVNSIISANVDAMTVVVNTNVVFACGSVTANDSSGSVKSALTAITAAVDPLSVTGTTIVADVKTMVADVFNAEGSVLFSAYHKAKPLNSVVNSVVADYAAGLNAINAIYDEFNALNIAAKKARDLAVLALNAANLANARIANQTMVVNSVNVPTFGTAAMTSTIVNQSMFNAATLSTAAANAIIDYNNLVVSYSSITPALVNAAVRSQKAIYKAAVSTNLATASSNPTPVTPQMVETLQGLVLKAKASTQLALETNPTSVNLKATLDLWNTAVSAGAAAVAGIADTLDTDAVTPQNEALRALFLAFGNNDLSKGPLGAIILAYNNGTKNTNYNFSPQSDMYIDGKAAYDFAKDFFTLGVNGGNLRYVMTVANNRIVEAWNAAQAANVAESNAARIAAQGLWETAANQIAQLFTPSNGFNFTSLAVPSVLHDAVCKAFQTTTGLALTPPDVYVGSVPTLVGPSDSTSTTEAYITAVAAYKAFMVAYDSYNKDFLLTLEQNANLAAIDKNNADVAIALAIASAARVNAAAKKSAEDSSALATSTQAIQDQAALNATEAAYAAADNVNMYRCIPDVAMHSDVEDLPVVFRLNGGNVYVGGTSVAAAMFAGFLGVVQSHNPINYFMNPVLYNNFTYPSPLFYDISGTSQLLNPGNVTSVYEWVVSERLDTMPNSLLPLIHGSYNPRVGLGSVRADALSAFLETPNLVTNMVTGPYPVVYQGPYVYLPTAPARAAIQTVTVYPGTTSDVYVFVAPAAAYNTNVTWSCSSPYNATVTQTLEAYGPVDISAAGSTRPIMAMVYRATVTGVVPVDPLAPVPVITIASTDGSNVFTTINVSVLPAVQVTGVSISSLGETKNPANTVLPLGQTLQLIATVTPVLATNKKVYWWSSNMSVVNVDVNGLLTPLAPGHVTIKATTVNNNISASISVYVPTPMTGISASPTMITLNPNTLIYPLKNTQLIKALVTPANADYKQLTWSIVSSQALGLPEGTTNQYGAPLYYAGDNTINTPVISLPAPDGMVLKRDSSGNILDNTQDLVTALSNGMAVINVSTANAVDSVYGTYSANVTVNVVTPITNVTLEQTNMVIDLNPQSAVAAINPTVNVQYGSQYGTKNSNWTLPAYNAVVSDRNRPEMYKVTATLFPRFPSNMNLIWTSSNPKVAIISNNTPPVLNTTASDPNFDLFQVTEMITPLANGSTVIKVTTADGNKVAMVNVTVTTPVTNINLSPMPVTLNPGAQYALQATVLPTTASNAGLVWQTTNTAVATVDQNGVVTAVASGSCGISVSTIDGDYTAMATINVVTPLVGVSLVLNTPTPIRIRDMVQILVVMTPTTASNQQFTWTLTNGINGSIFTNGPAQNGNIVYLDAAQAGSAVFTVTTNDGNKQASLALTVVNY